uniref:Peptidase S1 domain-containing protein n=1 Tax=Steinernema glaseri TaxID=37863 RepID=A0A1I7Z4V7_9BILA
MSAADTLALLVSRNEQPYLLAAGWGQEGTKKREPTIKITIANYISRQQRHTGRSTGESPARFLGLLRPTTTPTTKSTTIIW